jgi:putative ABC transport system permease protein
VGAGNIYSVALETYRNNELIEASAENYPGVGPALRKEMPEVMSYARLYNMGYKNNVVITNKAARPEQIAFKQHRFLYADSAFLPMIGYPMIKGNATTALAEPLTAVISEKYAQLYFGKTDPLGKMLDMQDDDFNIELVRVTGVFKELPPNTHLKFDVLFSYKTLIGRGDWASGRYEKSWQRKDMYTFIKLLPGTNPKALESRIGAIVSKYEPDHTKSHTHDVLSLQALKDIHLRSDLAEEFEANGNANIVFFLGLIGIFVLVIAWINYINLSTARSLERAREVGVRKVIGAYRGQLIFQFLSEAALINLLSVLIAIGLVGQALPYFNSLSGLSLDNSYLIKPWFLVLLLLLWIGGTLFSGFYPALVLSSFRPVKVLKGKLARDSARTMLRKGLVIFQFMASIALIAGTFIVYNQLNYMMKSNLGVNIDQVVVVDRPGVAASDRDRKSFTTAIDVFRSELRKDQSIESVTASTTIPGKQREFKEIVKRYGEPLGDSVTVRINSMDYDFMDVFKMKLLAGRNFSRDFPKDPDTSIIITESAARLLGFKKPEDAVGKILSIPAFGSNLIVVGVVNDYHQLSLKKTLDPTVFYCGPYDGEYYSMRVNASRIPQTLLHIQQSWTKAFPGNPFEYFFLDEYFNRQYANERKFGKLFTTFSILAILIGCLGLFGLSAYTAAQRIKEIGIRKVLGASATNIAIMLSKDFLKLIALAVLVATPITWFVMNLWLDQFAYRVKISWLIFIWSGSLAMLIALITVSFQAIKAAIANPVKSLRTE